MGLPQKKDTNGPNGPVLRKGLAKWESDLDMKPERYLEVAVGFAWGWFCLVWEASFFCRAATRKGVHSNINTPTSRW